MFFQSKFKFNPQVDFPVVRVMYPGSIFCAEHDYHTRFSGKNRFWPPGAKIGSKWPKINASKTKKFCQVQVQVDLLVIKRIKIHSYQLSNKHFHQFLQG